MNAPKLLLGGAACTVGLVCLGVLVAVKITVDCAKRAGLAVTARA